MKRYIILLALVLSLTAASAQQSFSFLNFVDTLQTITQVKTDQLVIKFADGNALAIIGEDTVKISLAALEHFEFTNIQEADNSHPKGDVDGNDVVDIDDLNILINIILKKDSASRYEGRAYVTGQGVVDIVDINAIINIILRKDDDN